MKTQIYVDGNGLRNSKEEIKYPLVQSEIITAEGYLKSKCKHIRSVNKKFDSYHLKNLAEKWGQAMNKHFNTDIFAPYVSNGAFIQAAINLGFMPSQIDRSINAYFPISLNA